MKIAEGGLYSPVMYLYNTGGIEAATDSRRYNEGSLHCACYNTARGKCYHTRREGTAKARCTP